MKKNNIIYLNGLIDLAQSRLGSKIVYKTDEFFAPAKRIINPWPPVFKEGVFDKHGWTGVKMGIKKGLTHAQEEMKELKDITLNQKFIKGKGNEKEIKDFQKIYKDDLIIKNKINKNIKAVVACGNGTAGIFAPDILRGIGCEVVELDCKLDWTFPKYNPNPEDMEIL